MSLLDLFLKLQREGIRLELIEGNLKISTPKGSMTPAFLKELKEKKEEIILFIKENTLKMSGFTAVEPSEEKEYYCLSSAQKRMYILQQMNSFSTGYNMPVVLRIEGNLDREKLRNVFGTLIARHDSLRTSFQIVKENPVQKIHDNINFFIEELTPNGLTCAVEEIISGFIRPFDLAQAPLIRVGLLTSGVNEYIFLVDMHHIISDGTSLDIIIREFMAVYAGEFTDPLNVQYKDYAEWQQTGAGANLLKQQESFWLEQFANEITDLELPNDFPRPGNWDFTGKTLHFELSKENTSSIKSLAARENVTIFMILLALYNVMLSKLCGIDDVVVGTPVAGRGHNDLRQVIGMFVNTLALRNFPAPQKTFREFLEELKIRTLNAFSNQDYPFETLVEQLTIERNTGRNPLFDTMFSLQNIDIPRLEIPGLKLEPYTFEQTVAKFDLLMELVESDGAIVGKISYSSSLFKRKTILTFIGYFKRVMTIVLNNPVIEIENIELITAEEKEQVLYLFNDTEAAYPREKTIHNFFEEHAEKNPSDTALMGPEGECITYGELFRNVTSLSLRLLEMGAGPETIVAIETKRSIDMVIGILGILKAGGAYLPIDPGYPRKRLDYILKDSNAQLMLTTGNSISELEEGFAVTHLAGAQNSFPMTLTPTLTHSPTQLCYIVYTSGSTGRPKGVMVEHRSVVNLLMVLEKMYPITGSGAFLLKTSFSFDVSVTELFSWFLGGGRLVILKPGREKDPASILAVIARNRITHINFVPPMFSVFLEELTPGNITTIKSLEYVFLAGEALPAELVRRFGELATSIRLENLYGPTEGTVYASGFPLHKWPGGERVSIGKPLDNVNLYILAQSGSVQPLGIRGELCISGDGVARGYLNRPELTAEKFVNFKMPRGSVITYKTGDLAKWLPDGNIQFMGRIDHQVKIRGFRVELEEIRQRLLEYDKIKEAVVIARVDELSGKYLCAYLVSREGIPDLEKLRQFLAQSLPDYMIPAHFVHLDAIPVNKNGKIDHNILPGPSFSPGKNYEAPRDEVEEKLVEIWSQLVNVDREKIGIDDNFFKLGGHSLSATIMTNMIHKELGVKIEMMEIFKKPSIRDIAFLVQTIMITVSPDTGDGIGKDSEEMVL